MRKDVEEFFLGLDDPNFLTMKLLHDLFLKFENDEVSRRVVENISVLSRQNIKLSYSEEAFSYVDLLDNGYDFAITSSGTEEIACHEFGHLLLNIFARGEIPTGFLKINRTCKKRILNKKRFISELLQKYRDKAYDILTEDIDDPLEFYERHPEFREEYFERYPDGTEEEMIEDRLEDHYALVSAFNEDIDNYNRVSNIIDAIFYGVNPFFLDYGKDDIECVLAMHNDDYFSEAYYGKHVASFEEQFADYLVLRTYPEKFSEARGVLHKVLGDEWFTLMDDFYDNLTKRICDKGKIYQHK